MKFEDVVLGLGVMGVVGSLAYTARPMLKAIPEAYRHATEALSKIFGA